MLSLIIGVFITLVITTFFILSKNKKGDDRNTAKKLFDACCRRLR